MNSTDSNPWFSHQHNAHFIGDSTLILFDNGNTRRASDANADSRGQVWKLDEQTMMATLLFNVDLGNYSDRVGSAQALSNGNYSFTSGAQGQPPIGQSIEVLPDGTNTYVLQVGKVLYRSYRLRSLYEGINDLLGPGGGATRPAPKHRTGTGSSPVAVDLNGDRIQQLASLAFRATDSMLKTNASVLDPRSLAAAVHPQPTAQASSSELSMPVTNANKLQTEMEEQSAGILSIFRSMGDKSTAARDSLFADLNIRLSSEAPSESARW